MYDIIEYIRSEIDAMTGRTTLVGALPTSEGVAVYIASGNIIDESRTRSHYGRCIITVNAKSKNQKDALQWLDTIHSNFNAERDFLNNDQIQITTIRTNTVPTYTGQQENEYYLYGSSLEIRFFEKREV